MKTNFLWCLLTALLLCCQSASSFADPTNTCPGLYYMDPNKSYSEAIEYAGDIDVLSITVPSSGILKVFTTGTTDTYGDLKDSYCNTIASNDDASGINNNLSITKNVTAGKYYIAIRHYSSSRTGNYGVSNTFTATEPTDSVGNTCSTATNLSINGSINSSIDSAGDYDYFRITLLNNSNLTVKTTGYTDTYGYLKDSNCNTIASNDNASYSDSNFLITKSVNAGTYYIAVRHYWSSVRTGSYTVSNIANTVTPVSGTIPSALIGRWSYNYVYGSINSSSAYTFNANGTYVSSFISKGWSCNGSAVEGVFNVQGNQIFFTPQRRYTTTNCDGTNLTPATLTVGSSQFTWSVSGSILYLDSLTYRKY